MITNKEIIDLVQYCIDNPINIEYYSSDYPIEQRGSYSVSLNKYNNNCYCSLNIFGETLSEQFILEINLTNSTLNAISESGNDGLFYNSLSNKIMIKDVEYDYTPESYFVLQTVLNSTEFRMYDLARTLKCTSMIVTVTVIMSKPPCIDVGTFYELYDKLRKSDV